jgi:hypothetical protein
VITLEQIRALALHFPQTDEAPHHQIIQFRVKKKVFATYNAPEARACLRFTESDQHAFCSFQKSPFYSVPNLWGKKYGWTLVDLTRADLEMLNDAFTTAYCTVAPPELAEPFRFKEED